VSEPTWGFINPETGDFIGVTEEGMRKRWAPGIDAQRLGAALHEVYCHRNAPMHSEPHHSAEAIASVYASLLTDSEGAR
jgi:hypothetical protein